MTTEQFKALAPYEKYFDTIKKAQYCRYPGAAALQVIHSVVCSLMGERKLNTSCSHCVYELMNDAGTLYYKEKAAREAKPVELKAVDAQPVKKAAVKTTKKKATAKK